MKKRTSKKLKKVISIVLVSSVILLLLGGFSIYFIVHSYIHKMHIINTEETLEVTQEIMQKEAKNETIDAMENKTQDDALRDTQNENQDVEQEEEQIVTQGVITGASNNGNDPNQVTSSGEDNLEVFSNYSDDQMNIMNGTDAGGNTTDVLSEEKDIAVSDNQTSSSDLNESAYGDTIELSLEEIAALDQLINKNTANNQLAAENSDITNILLIGSDAQNIDDEGSSESIIVISINSDQKKIVATTFMENIYLQIPGYENNRLNAAYVNGGTELLMDTIEINFGMRIDKYILADFLACIDIADTIGGITMEVKGLNILEMNEFLNTFLPQITTNYTETEILALLLKLPSYSDYEIEEFCIPMEDTYENYTLQGEEVFGIDFDKNIDELYKRIFAF